MVSPAFVSHADGDRKVADAICPAREGGRGTPGIATHDLR
jgi:hypothetical protein